MPLIALATFTLGLAGIPAMLEDWEILMEADNDVVFWIDRDSIRDLGAYRQARTKSDYSRVSWGEVGARITTEDYDCEKRALRPRASIAYRRDGSVLRTMNQSEEEAKWTVAQPGSVADAKIDAVCEP